MDVTPKDVNARTRAPDLALAEQKACGQEKDPMFSSRGTVEEPKCVWLRRSISQLPALRSEWSLQQPGAFPVPVLLHMPSGARPTGRGLFSGNSS